MTDRVETFARNYVFILTSRVLRVGVGLVLLPGLARGLKVDEFGNFVFVINLAASVMSIAFYGLGQALVRDVSANKDRAGEYVGAALKLRAYLTFFSLFVLIVLASLMNNGWTIFLALSIAAFSEILKAFSDLAKDVYRAFERMHYETYVTTVYSICLLAFIGAVLAFKGGLIAVVSAILIASIIQFAMSMNIMLKKFVLPARTIPESILRDFLKDALALGVGVLFVQILWRLPMLFLNQVKGAREVAFFEAAHGLVIQTLILSEVFMAVFLPGLTGMISSNSANHIASVGRKLFKVLLVFSTNVAIVFLVFSDRLIHFVYGSDYGDAVSVLRILSPCVVLLFLTGFAHVFLISMKMQKQFIICNGVSTGVAFVFMPLFTARYGLDGTAFASALAYGVNFGLSMYFLDRLAVKLPVGTTLTVVALGVAASIAGAIVDCYNVVAAVLVLEIIFLAPIVRGAVFNGEERQFMMGLLVKFKSLRGKQA